MAKRRVTDIARERGLDPNEVARVLFEAGVPMARDMVLSAHTWGFNTRRATLVEFSGAVIPPSWEFAYARPNLCLRVIGIYAPGALDDADSADFLEESQVDGAFSIFTNVEEATARFLVQVTDPTKYSAHCVYAMSRLLASMLAGPIIKGARGMDVAAKQLKLYEIAIAQAATLDARSQQTSVANDFTPSSIAARA